MTADCDEGVGNGGAEKGRRGEVGVGHYAVVINGGVD